MLVPAMNNDEVSVELMRDYRRIQQGAMHRLFEDYHKERKKRRIDSRSEWIKDYTITTSSKNRWIIFIQKAPFKTKYKDMGDMISCCVTYYYPDRGLRVFRPSEQFIEVFNGHFFTRYNERMDLNLFYPIDVIKKFFHRNGFLQPQPVKDGQKEYIMSVCKEGMALGNWQTNTHNWLVHKTFINHEQKHQTQAVYEHQVFEKAQKHCEEMIAQSNEMEQIQSYKNVIGILNHIAKRA